jgi:nitrate reductase delta subunit
VEFAAAYKLEGFAVADGELPDYLPAVLDLAAHGGESAGTCCGYTGSGWICSPQALRAQHSVYRHAVDAVRLLLPAATATELSAVATLAPLRATAGRGGPAALHSRPGSHR